MWFVLYLKWIRKKCSAYNIKIDEDNYREERTVCKGCYTLKERKNNNNTRIQNQQPKIGIVNNNKDNKNRTLLVGPSFSDEIHLMLKIFSRITDQIFTWSPNHLPNSIQIINQI